MTVRFTPAGISSCTGDWRPWNPAPGAQWSGTPDSPVTPTGPPVRAVTAGPTNRPVLPFQSATLRANAGSPMPKPKMCRSSCVATLSKSYCPAAGAVVVLNDQFTSLSNVIIPPQVLKSVLGPPAAAPACPRVRTVFSQPLPPLAENPPVLARPSSSPGSLAPPTYTTSSFCRTTGLSRTTVLPVAGFQTDACQELPPPGARAARSSPRRSAMLWAAFSRVARRAASAKNPDVS